ncbi:MAG: RluA family pseudouridine synthase, partial [Oscillospiraceae bacterium]
MALSDTIEERKKSEGAGKMAERRIGLVAPYDCKVQTLLRKHLRLTASVVSRAKMEPDGITLDGVRVFTDAIAKKGQTLSLLLSDRENGDLVPSKGPVNIVYEDEDLLVADKPAGLPVYPAHGQGTDTLGNYLAEYYRERGIPFVFRAVNRLDRGTSGLMVVAKHAHCHEVLKHQLHTGDFRRIYLAVVDGAPPETSGIIDAPIGRAEGTILGRVVTPNGDRAVTHYEVVSRGSRRSLVRLELETGRTHQIRVHMAYVGCPVTGDFLYGTEHPLLPGRTALHSAELFLTGPITGETLHVTAPI